VEKWYLHDLIVKLKKRRNWSRGLVV